MTAEVESNSTLVSKCLAFCQTLASQGQVFSFSLVIGPDFSFSLDTRSKEQCSLEAKKKKKKQSPSTLRRNARRREEFAKKKQASSAETLADDEQLTSAQAPKCDQCDYVGTSEKGLKQHMRMKHKASGAAPQKENLRGSQKEASLLASPMLDVSREECNLNREEVGEENGEPASPLQPSPSSPPSMLCKQCVEEITGNTWHRIGEPWCEDCVRVYFTG